MWTTDEEVHMAKYTSCFLLSWEPGGLPLDEWGGIGGTCN